MKKWLNGKTFPLGKNLPKTFVSLAQKLYICKVKETIKLQNIMCLKSKGKVYQAKRDKTVWKVLCIDENGAYAPYHCDFRYDLEKTYCEPGTCFSTGWVNEDEWFRDCYSYDDEGNKQYHVHRGFHAFRSWDDAWCAAQTKIGLDESNVKRRIFKCVIPKGSYYMKGIDGDIVSNKIIVKKRLIDRIFGK